jgi:hypothetical protein
LSIHMQVIKFWQIAIVQNFIFPRNFSRKP